MNIIISVFLISLSVALVGLLVYSNIKINKKRAEMTKQIDALKKEVQELENNKEAMESSLQQTQTQEFVEKEAREKLGYKKPGEEVAVVVPPATNSEGVAEPSKSFWEKILNKIGF